MAEDTLLRERLRRALPDMHHGSPDLERVGRRARVLIVRRVASIAIAVALGCVLIAVPLMQLSHLGEATPSPAAPIEEPALSFDEAPGWYTERSEAVNFGSPSVWASTVPFAGSDLAGDSPTIGYPDATIEGLPRDGILIVASDVVESRNPMPPDPRFPDEPLRLGEPQENYEGLRPGTSLALAGARVNGRFVNVAAYFGSTNVPNEILRRANEQLRRLVVAPLPAPTEQLDDFGIQMEVPDAWNRLLYSYGGGSVELRAGTTPITAVADTIPGRKDMDPDDVAVALSESFAVQDRFEPVEGNITLRAEDLCPSCEVLDGGSPPPPGHALYARSFSVGNRRFLLYAEFGSSPVAEEDLASVNGILATLRIEASGSLEPSDPGATPTTLPPGPSLTASMGEAFRYQGLELDVPAGWSAVAAPLDQPAVAPVVAAFGSWQLPAGGACAPEIALASLPDDGALAWIAEHPSPSNRGDYIDFSFWRHDRTHQPMRWECGNAAPSRMDLWQTEDGRFLEVHVAFGPHATAERIAEVESLLDSLRSTS